MLRHRGHERQRAPARASSMSSLRRHLELRHRSRTACTNCASGPLWAAYRVVHGHRGYMQLATLNGMECGLGSVRSRERVTYVLFGGISFDTATVPVAPRVEVAMLVRRIVPVVEASVVSELPAKVNEAHAKTPGPCIRRRIVHGNMHSLAHSQSMQLHEGYLRILYMFFWRS